MSDSFQVAEVLLKSGANDASTSDVEVFEPMGNDESERFAQDSVHWWPLRHDGVEPDYPWSFQVQCQTLLDTNEGAMLQEYVGRIYHFLHTNGNGGCSIHSLFGKPDVADGDRMFAKRARSRTIATIGRTAIEFRGRLQSDVFFDAVTSCIWGDYLLPILYKENNIHQGMEIFQQGQILWDGVKQDPVLRQSLLQHVRRKHEELQCAELVYRNVSECFKEACRPKYAVFLSLLISKLNEGTDADSPHWNMFRTPWEERNGVFIVRSSARTSARIDALAEDTPQTMWAALLDSRSLFDSVRESLLRCRGSNYMMLQRAVDSVVDTCNSAALREDGIIRRFREALAIATVTNLQTEMSVPHKFLERVWKHYLQALSDPDYWLSYDELIALATIAKVRTLVLQNSNAQLTCKGHNFDAVPAENEARTVIIALTGRIHFERLMDATEHCALQKATEQRCQTRTNLAYEHARMSLEDDFSALSFACASMSLGQECTRMQREDKLSEMWRAHVDSDVSSDSDMFLFSDHGDDSSDVPCSDDGADPSSADAANKSSRLDEPSVAEKSAKKKTQGASSANSFLPSISEMQDAASDDLQEQPAQQQGKSENGASEDELDAFSDISDNSDLFHVQAVSCDMPRTDQDKELRLAQEIAKHLRDYPLLPCTQDSDGTEHTFMDVASGMNLPWLHCGFKGCRWQCKKDLRFHWDAEVELFRHLEREHKHKELAHLPASAWPEYFGQPSRRIAKDYDFEAVAYYLYATCLREQEHIPIIGPSVDRRMLALMQRAINSRTVCSAMCFACTGIHTFVEKWSKMHQECVEDASGDIDRSSIFRNRHVHSEISWHTVRDTLLRWSREQTQAFLDNFQLKRYRDRYASNSSPDGNPFLHCQELLEGNSWEWQRELLLPQGGVQVLLCCPEDVRCEKAHAKHQLCPECLIPICKTCHLAAWSQKCNYRIPMALANDNFWGYTTSLISQYQVRWIEAAIVSPCWTSMIIYYVEADHGHLMNETLGEQKYRTVVRGSCVSYHMPWEDILENLQRNCSDRNLADIPHPQEALKYMLRVHLQVAGQDFKKYLKQVTVRPWVLIRLLDFLIDRNHEVFRGKGSAEELRRRMREAVEREYPVAPADRGKPEEEQAGSVPPSILELLQEHHGSAEAAPEEEQECTAKRLRLFREKNATPGDGARSVEACLEDLRPQTMCADRSAAACSDPGTQREGAIERYGQLNVCTGGKEILQFHSKYFSQVLPFVIPFMVSGPDFFPDQRWRRRDENAPWVSPQASFLSFYLWNPFCESAQTNTPSPHTHPAIHPSIDHVK